MRKATLLFALLIASLTFCFTAKAQDQAGPAATAKTPEPTEHFYKITFVVQELDQNGKPVNSRSYATTVSTARGSGQEMIRTGSRVPIIVGSYSQTDNGAGVNTQFQYMDVGINFDVHDVHEVGRQLALQVRADVSSLAPSEDPKLTKVNQPVVRHNQWESPVLIPIGKATPIFTSDAIDTKGSMQVVATATLLQ
jgi:hypothetical protein